ncbi:unnamed protein product [Euphydryas editha]|uniref:Uncharacterized protein n=1 Tax=Euphydryas editha TaxID=104508 RepID=A0AAU9TDJ7_EUPED|nr:unnamed protein product [Euphydryas editha]
MSRKNEPIDATVFLEITKENFSTSTQNFNENENLQVDQGFSPIAAGTSAEKVFVRDRHQFSRYGTVVATLKAKPGGQDLLKSLRSDIIFDDKKRKALVRLLMSELVDHHATHYPPEEAKIALAKAIVTEFPRLKDSFFENGWEPYYDKNSKKGFLEYRLYTMRSSLSPSKKMYSKAAMKRKEKETHSSSSQFVSGLTEAEITQKVSVMKNCNPTDQNKEKIITLLEETRSFRRQWIEQSSPTISEIFTQYPRLLDYDGEMIEREFDSLHPKSADNFMKKFPTFYAPRIYHYVKQCKPTLYTESAIIKDENLRALMMLCTLLPVSNSIITRKGKGKGKKREHEESNENPEPLKTNAFPNKDLLKIVAYGTDLTNYVKDLKERQITNIQPYLVLVKGQDTETCFVEGDNWFIKMNQKSTPIAAFNLLYKLFYVLNLKYPDNLQNFYNFIDCYIFAMKEVQPRSSVSSLHVVFNNTLLNDTADDPSSD